jgi:hypothetical protein
MSDINNNLKKIDISNLIHNCEYKTNSNKKTETCKLCVIIKFIEELELHNDCDRYQCMICSLRDCPSGDIYHYDYHGCPTCYKQNRD